jgi:hypothetical protein
MAKRQRNILKAGLWASALPLLAACVQLGPAEPAAQAPQPTPTVAPLFRPAATLPPQPSAPPTTATATPADPTPPPSPTPDPRIAETPIYDDALDAGWSAEHSGDVRFDLAAPASGEAGAKAIAVTPLKDFGTFFLTVREQAGAAYRRDKVLGVSFWLSGDNAIETSDLAVTVVGSNKYTYWRADDTSVQIDGRVTSDPWLYSETRLYYLGINRAIPPRTWTEVVLWLDDRIYDPGYTYVTGIYIKNDEQFRGTYYVDRVKLLMKR